MDELYYIIVFITFISVSFLYIIVRKLKCHTRSKIYIGTNKEDQMLNQIVKPLYNQTVKPLYNQTVKPLYNQTVKPLYNQTVKPLYNQTVKPIISEKPNFTPIISDKSVVSKKVIPISDIEVNINQQPNYYRQRSQTDPIPIPIPVPKTYTKYNSYDSYLNKFSHGSDSDSDYGFYVNIDN